MPPGGPGHRLVQIDRALRRVMTLIGRAIGILILVLVAVIMFDIATRGAGNISDGVQHGRLALDDRPPRLPDFTHKRRRRIKSPGEPKLGLPEHSRRIGRDFTRRGVQTTHRPIRAENQKPVSHRRRNGPVEAHHARRAASIGKPVTPQTLAS